MPVCEQPRAYLACQCYGGLLNTPKDVLEVEDLPEEELEVVGISMLVREHPELMEAAKIEAKVQREAAAERAENLRVWAHGLLEKQLEKGVPDAPQVQAWRGTIVQGAHPINSVGLRAEAVKKGIVGVVGAICRSCSGLVACLEEGLPVVNYIWQDTCPLAKRVAPTLFPKLMQRFPWQLPALAIKGFNRKLPEDIRLTSAMMLANLGKIDVVVGG